jgi:hypothetical protein
MDKLGTKGCYLIAVVGSRPFEILHVPDDDLTAEKDSYIIYPVSYRIWARDSFLGTAQNRGVHNWLRGGAEFSHFPVGSRTWEHDQARIQKSSN